MGKLLLFGAIPWFLVNSLTPSLQEMEQAWRRGWASALHYALPSCRGPWRSGSGLQRRRVSGQSLDFNDHRPYVQGDDVRHINWRVYAATGQMVLKTFEEEVNPCADIVVDGSCSMTLTAEKKLRSIELTAWLVASCERQGLKTSLMFLGKKIQRCETLCEGSVPEFFVGEPLTHLSLEDLPWRSHSLRILVSDLLIPRDLQETLRPLAKGAGGAWIYCPYDECEVNPQWSDNLKLVDVDTGVEKRITVDAALLERYQWAYRAHVDEAIKACMQLGLDLHRISAQWPWLKVLPSLGERAATWLA